MHNRILCHDLLKPRSNDLATVTEQTPSSSKWEIALATQKIDLAPKVVREWLTHEKWSRMMRLDASVNVYHQADPQLLKRLDVLQSKIQDLQETLESYLDVQDEPDNYDMSVEEVKKLILKECKRGEEYYPGEFSLKHGLDYDTVVEALNSLQKEDCVEY